MAAAKLRPTALGRALAHQAAIQNRLILDFFSSNRPRIAPGLFVAPFALRNSRLFAAIKAHNDLTAFPAEYFARFALGLQIESSLRCFGKT